MLARTATVVSNTKWHNNLPAFRNFVGRSCTILHRRCSAANGYPFRSHTFHLGESTIAIRKSGRFRMLSTITRGHYSTVNVHLPVTAALLQTSLAETRLFSWSRTQPFQRVWPHTMECLVPDRLAPTAGRRLSPASANRQRRAQVSLLGIRPHRGRWRCWRPPHPLTLCAPLPVSRLRLSDRWFIGCLGETAWMGPGAGAFVGPAVLEPGLWSRWAPRWLRLRPSGVDSYSDIDSDLIWVNDTTTNSKL